MLDRRGAARRAAVLLEFAKSTRDPRLSAVLVEKAADLKSQIDQLPTNPNISPMAPDVEQED